MNENSEFLEEYNYHIEKNEKNKKNKKAQLTELNRNLPSTNTKSLKRISNNEESNPQKNMEKFKILEPLEECKTFTFSKPEHKIFGEKKQIHFKQAMEKLHYALIDLNLDDEKENNNNHINRNIDFDIDESKDNKINETDS